MVVNGESQINGAFAVRASGENRAGADEGVMEERGAGKGGCGGEEGAEGGGMGGVGGVGEDEGGGDGDAGGQEAVEDGEGVHSLGGSERLCGAAEGEDVWGVPPLRCRGGGETTDKTGIVEHNISI